MRLRAALALVLGAVAAAASAASESRNGFSLEPTSIPVSEIVAGGPPRDGIPALDHPARVDARAAALSPDARVLGVAIGGEAIAYPLAILEWHELVNDTVGGAPIVVSYCPLCGTAMVFERRIAGRMRTFGVSGLLYRSGLLLYDRETESLWSQIRSEAVTGTSLGQRMTLVRAASLTWREWREREPGSKVLSRETGHRRPYGRSPYGDYASSDDLHASAPRDPRYSPKTPTVGLRLRSGAARAYPAVELLRAGGETDEDFEGRRVRVAYDAERRTFRVDAPPDVEIVEGYWFAWAAFHPRSSVFVAPRRRDERAAEGSTPAR
jgi:hypothetical protein